MAASAAVTASTRDLSRARMAEITGAANGQPIGPLASKEVLSVRTSTSAFIAYALC